MARRAPFPVYDPSTDSGLALWLDATDSTSSSLLNTGGGAITNGATVGTWKSKKGTARSFTQWGTNVRPTWDSTGIGGLGAVRFTTPQCLATQTTMTDFASMTGLTIMVVQKLGTFSSTNDCSCGFTMLDQGTGLSDISQVFVACRNDTGRKVGGRRARGDAFQSVSGVLTPLSPGIITGIFDFSNAKLSAFMGGVEDGIAQTFQTAGSTNAADPFAIAVGGFAQQTSNALGLPFDGWVSQVLVWLTAKTPDQLVPIHHWARTHFSIN